MRNPLLDSFNEWQARRSGHIVIYKWEGIDRRYSENTGDLKYLITLANLYYNKSDKTEPDDYFDSRLGFTVGYWMERYLKSGFDTKMLQELRGVLGRIRFYHTLNPAIPSRGKPLPHWDYEAETEDFIEPEIIASYAFAQQLTLNGLEKLKRCKQPSCNNFFFGRPNSKWCKEACGSLNRVRRKRRRDS